ncbi:MAG: hypothetical protein HY075_09030, partial [Deltaproteobacteria bacterium]|nr:hypothetical protein [Deltaproteobacteria bacterium]
MSQPHIHLVGFGSQGTAWAENLRRSGWQVSVYLGRSDSASFEKARALGFDPALIIELPKRLAASPAPADGAAMVAMLVPDHLIAPLYREFVASVARPLTIVLAHGYAVYAGELVALAAGHEPALLAPKAIGPKLEAAHKAVAPEPHHLVAAISAGDARDGSVVALAQGLGFAPERLVRASFEQEAVGDLISEQTLLCGGVFNLIEWTMEAMHEAGVPADLIREECLTELELIAGLIRERGVAATLGKISPAAQCGTIAMRERLVRAGVPEAIAEQARDVVSRKFV